ncbi:MAG: hypothetical protein HY261_05380 [Chloroflexi bacterium]|nr:hypothetical protein [Chloroflexota bacterium]
MTRRTIYLTTLAGLLIAASSMAHPAAAPGKVVPRSENVTMSGEIIDPQCYFTHDSRGPAHARCASLCAEGGQGLAFLDAASGVVYPLIANAHGADQNDGLLPHLGKPVEVKGVVYRKASNAVLLIQSVAASPAKTR